MVVGRPRVCPQTWARCPLPKRVKSGMLRLSVLQKPIMPMRPGKKIFQKSAPQPTRDGSSRSVPKPPALFAIHTSRTTAPTRTNGAAQFSKRRRVSMPR